MIRVGCCCNLCPSSALVVDQFGNVTKVMDWAYDPNPDGIAPYGRKWYVIQDGSCIPAGDEPNAICGRSGSAEHPEDAQAVCYNQGFDRDTAGGGIHPSGILDCAWTEILDNCYKATGATVDLDHRRMGWKSVRASAVWAGIYGFTNTGKSDCCPSNGQVQSKYTSIRMHLTAHRDTTYTSTDSGGTTSSGQEYHYSHEWDQTATVDDHGNVTRAGSGFKHSHWKYYLPGNPDLSHDLTDDCDGIYAWGVGGQGLTEWNITPTIWGAPVSDAGLGPGSPSFGYDVCLGTIGFAGYSGTPAELTAMEIFKVQAPLLPDYESTTVTDEDKGTFTMTDDEIKITYGATVTARQYAFDDSGAHSDMSDDYRFELVIKLSGSRTFTQVKQDAIDLLDTWPLNDDAVHPWRTDAKTWLLPMVRRDAYATEPSIDWTVDPITCDFSDSEPYTGDIIGAPNPAGYARHFNFNHITWGPAERDGICNHCETERGATSPDEIPPAATLWTDTSEGASTCGPGAHVQQIIDYTYGSNAVGPTPIEGVVMQKWAETLEAWPAINDVRPCAMDRYQIEEATAVCLVDFTDPDVTTSADITLIVGDHVVVQGGVYPVASVTDGTHFSVGTKIVDVPATVVEYMGGEHEDSDFVVAKIRFKDARPICGRLAVAAVQTSPGLITITVPTAHWLRDGDKVDFYSVSGLADDVTVTVTGPTTFTVPGTLGAYTSGGHVASHGFTDWAFNTDATRHTFVTREWKSLYREAADAIALDGDATPDYWTYTETEGVKAPVACYPTVLCISPNIDDTFANGVIWSWDNTVIDADQCYGQEWHRDFVQAVKDPFWQVPHWPFELNELDECDTINDLWRQQPSPCVSEPAMVVIGDLPKIVNYYLFPPYVEARLTAPEGAPAIPVPFSVSGGMPGAVDAPYCVSTPNSRGTVHEFRAAWEGCDDWKTKLTPHGL